MLTGLAHVAICVPDVDEAVEWYRSVLGLRVLSPPYELSGEAIERDMGELLPSPVVVKAAIIGMESGDHVIEVIEYPRAPADPGRGPGALTDHRITHVGLVCDDAEATRHELEDRGVTFLTTSNANVAGLTTTWFRDPWSNVFILMSKSRPERAYWQQYGGG